MHLSEDPKIVSDDGEFHIEDEVVDLSGTTPEAWAALGLFWALGATVFYQFITRYVFNDSASWTEEIARYLLIGVVFVGAAIGVSRNNHIQVDLIYRYVPATLGRSLSTLVDALRVLFFGATVVLTLQMMVRMGSYRMTIVDLPMNLVYGVCLVGFTAMFYRALRRATLHWRRGWSVLERPDGETPAD